MARLTFPCGCRMGYGPLPGGSVAQLQRALLATWPCCGVPLKFCRAHLAAFGSLARNVACGLNGAMECVPFSATICCDLRGLCLDLVGQCVSQVLASVL